MPVRTDDHNGANGLTCPGCGGYRSKVLDTRYFHTYIRRRRECKDCGRRMTTHELSMEEMEAKLGNIGNDLIELLNMYRVRMPRGKAKKKTDAQIQSEAE